MKQKFQRFIIKLAILSLALGFVWYLLYSFIPAGYISPLLPYLLLMFFIVSAVVHYILLRIVSMNPRRFVSYFMLATFLKLMNYLIVLVVIVINMKEGKLPFILSFFLLYIIYTIFEVVSILSQTKAQDA